MEAPAPGFITHRKPKRYVLPSEVDPPIASIVSLSVEEFAIFTRVVWLGLCVLDIERTGLAELRSVPDAIPIPT